MKKLMAILLMMLPLATMAQISFGDLVSKYNGAEGVTTAEFSGSILKMMADEGSTGKNSGGENIFSGLESLKMLVYENPSQGFTTEAHSMLENSYVPIATINHEGSKTSFYQRDRDKLSEFILFSHESNVIVMIYISGSGLDAKKISAISDMLNN